MEASGLTWLGLGVETGSPRILKDIGKDLVIGDVIRSSERLKKYNFFVRYNFMSGYIEETLDDLKQTTVLILELLRNNRKNSIMSFRVCVPHPKTRYYAQAVSWGLKEPARLEDWAVFSPNKWVSLVPWLNPKKRIRLETLYIGSFFIDNKADTMTSKNLAAIFFKLLAMVYRPIAMIRFKYASAFCPFEALIYKIVRKIT